jgi:hypothetical protein
MAMAAYIIGMQMRREGTSSDRSNPCRQYVNPPGLATTETLTQHINLNYFSEAVSSEVKARLADADSTSTPSSGCSPRVERLVES